jgi:hypothetical protein
MKPVCALFPSQGYPAESFGLESGKPDVYLQLMETRVTKYWKYELVAETLERQ